MSRRIAFLWGSNAKKPYPTLKYAKRDVERLRLTLVSSRYGFEIATPPDASGPHQIYEAVDKAARSCEPDDVFIAYFSGHGQLTGARLYLVLDKSIPSEPATMFSSTLLLDALRGCRARNRLLILDCCHAGAATGVKAGGVDVAELFPDHRNERVLYASGKLESAREFEEFEGSFLTRMLCESLAAAPPGSVTLSQVVDALQQAAAARNRQAPPEQQVPVPYLSGLQQGDFDFTSPAGSSASSISRKIVVDTRWLTHKSRRRRAFKRTISELHTGLRAAASDGQGAYFFAMLAFGLAAFLFHDARQAQNEAQTYLRNNLTRSQDPPRTGRYPVLDRLLLPRNSLCNEALSKDFDAIYTAFIKSSPKALLLKERKLTKATQLVTGAEPPWTDNEPNSTLLISDSLAYSFGHPFAQYRSSMTGPPYSNPSADGSQEIYHKFREVIEKSVAITDDNISEHLRSYSTLPDMFRINMSRMNRLHYVSAEGVSRTTPRWDLSNPWTHRVFNTEGYIYNANFRNTRQCSDHNITLPFFDLNGDGITETICKAISGHREASELFCADIALPEYAVLEHLAEMSDVFNISVIQVTNSERKTCSIPRGFQSETCKKLSGSQMNDSKGKAATYYSKVLDSNAEGNAGGVLRLDGDEDDTALEDQVFGISVFHQPPPLSEFWDVAIVKIRPLVARNPASPPFCALSLLIGVGIIVQSFQRKLRRQQSLLSRGLPYGLLELSHGKIIGANDRAEEILRTKLPRLGIHSAQVESGKTFAPMINDVCVLLPLHDGVLSESDVCGYDGRIRDRATDGLTSVFYAWVKQVQMWIKVTSTIILLPNGTEHVVCALDTAIDRQHEALLATVRSRFSDREEE